MNINITTFQLGPIGTNCYLLEIDAAVLIVDPGGDAEVLTNYIATHQLTPVAIVLTHAHFDHIGAVEQLQHTYDLNVYLHEAEHSWLTDPHKNGSSGMLHHEVTVQVSPPVIRGRTSKHWGFFIPCPAYPWTFTRKYQSCI
ncbi:MBL fold metallo-hydrolase [Virgibacillus halophilus]|uniref:MBL fold metallo-hydrolase n=1 Tax=Tigheibacillus halophilus TaxID=361280 RepID=A0ABU5CBL9_9BACI|nr:MBL fold metallo-hydrolase [Virgibacillus halophilus]